MDEIEFNWKNRLLLENVILTCHKMNIKVVAEGVENKQQVYFLQRINCDFIQGFYIDKPLSMEEFEKKYTRNHQSVISDWR